MNKFYIIFYFILNSLAWGQTQVIPSLEASAGNLATPGAVPYISAPGVLNQDASNFFWDISNHRLGIGTNAPSTALTLATGQLSVPNGSASAPSIVFPLNGGGANNAGIYSPGINSVAIATGGSSAVQFGANSATLGYWDGGSTYLQGPSAGAGNLNRAGEHVVIQGGKSTGSGAGGSILFEVSPSASSGTSLNAYVTRAAITNGSFGIGPSNTSPTGTLHVYDATASTGVTTLTVKAGAGQSTTNLQEWQNSSGAVLGGIVSDGGVFFGSASTTKLYSQAAGRIGMTLNGTLDQLFALGEQRQRSAVALTWSSGDPSAAVGDTSLSRVSAGIVGVGTGAAGSTAGIIQAAALLTNAVKFADRPETPTEGMIVAFTDSTTVTWGATITGTGSNHVLGYYNGTNWTVIGK